MDTPPLEDLLGELTPQVLGALVSRHRSAGTADFAMCEDAVAEAVLAALRQWPVEGVPERPRGWLLTVAHRRVVDDIRSESARRRREESAARAETADIRDPMTAVDITADIERAPAHDDTLDLFFLCAHPNLSSTSQIALTLRAVGGLSTAEIARALLVAEATMTRRLTRARTAVDEVLRTEGSLTARDEAGWHDRVTIVLGVLYLIFNEGYAASGGPDLQRRDLAAEAIRLTRLLHRAIPDDTETAGLLSLMLLTEARHDARTGADGALVPLAEQDRGRWDAAMIAEATELLLATLPRGRVGTYQLQAAIAACHAEAPSVADTDWPQILALYRVLEQVTGSPVVTLNRVVVELEVNGLEAATALYDSIVDEPRLARSHRVLVVGAHLRERAGDAAGAAELYRLAAVHTMSLPERRHLNARARELAGE